MVSAQEIRVVAELLQISPEALQKAITYKVTVSISVGNYSLITFDILLKMIINKSWSRIITNPSQNGWFCSVRLQLRLTP